MFCSSTMLGRTVVSRAVTGALQSNHHRRLLSSNNKMTTAEREAAIRNVNKTMKGYAETRILAKQGLLRKREASKKTQSASKIQLALLISLSAAFIAR